MADDLPVILFPSAAELEAWLEDEHARSDGIWLKIARKGTGVESVTHAEAVEVGLCFGWIDGQARRLDDRHYLQRFTPRRPRSRWSRLNRERVEALDAAGRMRPSGLAEVEAAKADGRWDAAYEPPSTAEVPPDLERELKRDRAAREAFEALDGANRYAIIYRLNDAKRPETRERRLRKFLEMLRRGERIHP
ncbi:MAG TPA: YdeI/OmpD-associated family protein [Solirubrobacterales bacterium]|nr:YdeI/OmpD-associated family protein [Solirubrobacterales bacterium]